MSIRGALRAVRRGILPAALILIPLVAPLFVIAALRSTPAKPRDDMKVHITRDLPIEEFARFAPRKLFAVGLHLQELRSISLSERSYQAQFLYWGRNYFHRSRNDRSQLPEDELRVVNQGRSFSASKHVVRSVEGEGSSPSPFVAYVSYAASGPLYGDFPLHRYPFDSHTLEIVIEPRSLLAEDFLLSVDPNSTLSGAIDPGEWSIKSFTATSEVRTAQSDFSDPALVRKGTVWTSVPRVTFRVEIRRNLLPLLTKVLFPLSALMVIVYCSFFIPLMEVANRRGIAILALLSVTALHVGRSGDLRAVPYLTALDQFFLIAYAGLLLVMLEPVITGRILSRFTEEERKAPDVQLRHPWLRFGLPALRIVFPLWLAGGWYWIALRAGI